MALNLALTVPQTKFFTAEEEYVACVAGYGSGKTQGALWRTLASMFKYPKMNFAYLAPTYPLIRDIFYPKISEALEILGIGYKINKSENIVHIQGHGEIYCRTMERPEYIVGWEVGDAVLDEFDVLPVDKAVEVFNKISARCRQKFPDGKVNQKLVITTPEGYKATYTLFKKAPLINSRLIQMSTYSNRSNLAPGYIEGLENQYPEQLIKAYLNGEFVNLTSGTVYYAYDRNENNSIVTLHPREPVHIGLDFNVLKMAASVGVHRSGRCHLVDELIDLRDTPDMIEEIQERYQMNGHPVFVYPDATGRNTSAKSASMSDIKLLRAAKFQVKAKKANPLVRNRIACVNKLLTDGNLMVNADRCPHTAEALEQQAYDKNGKPDKAGGMDHILDALGYQCYYYNPIIKNTLQRSPLRGL